MTSTVRDYLVARMEKLADQFENADLSVKEHDELRKEFDSTVDQVRRIDRDEELRRQIEAIPSPSVRIEMLERALRRYGGHTSGCRSALMRLGCTCGWERLKAKLGA